MSSASPHPPPPFRPPELYPRGLPTPEDLLADPGLFDRLSPQQQEQVVQLLESIPTPGAETRLADELAGQDFLTFDRVTLGNHPSPAALALGYHSAFSPDQLRVVEALEREQFVAVTAGHGVGKTNLAARYILYFLLTRPDSRVITTATTWHQVEKQLWQEIAMIYARAPQQLPGELLTTELRLGPGWFAVGLSTTDYTKFAGSHAPGGVLVWIDEATGVRGEIARAAEAMVITPRDKLVAVGNPTDPTSWFKGACTRPGWVWLRLDCRQHPNVLHDNPDVIPGAVTRKWVEDRRRTYGEQSPIFKSTVAGEWPDVAEDSVLSLTAITAAQQLGEHRRLLGYLDPSPRVQEELDQLEILDRRAVRPPIFCLDIAGPGGDLLTLGRVKRRHYSVVGWKQRQDYMDNLNWVVQQVEQEEPAVLVLDDTGVGGVFSSRLFELQRRDDAHPALAQLRVVPINFGSSSGDPRFIRMKDWLWWNLREVLTDPLEEFSIPGDLEVFAMNPPLPEGHALLEQLEKAIYMLDEGQKIRVFDKYADYSDRTRLLPARSPDLAHALILGAWGMKLLREEHREAPPKTPAEASTAAFHQAMRARRVEEMGGRGRGGGEELVGELEAGGWAPWMRQGGPGEGGLPWPGSDFPEDDL